jgi:hypothetical protein
LNNSRDITSTADPSVSTTRLPEIPTPVLVVDAVALAADVVAAVVEAEVSAVVVAVEEDSVVVVEAVEAEVEDSVEAVAAAVEEDSPSKARKLHSKQYTRGTGGLFRRILCNDPVAFTVIRGVQRGHWGLFLLNLFEICGLSRGLFPFYFFLILV